MSFDLIKGQKRAISRIEEALASGKLAHALVFAGPDGVGKRTTAMETAKAILCERSQARACDACGSCRRAAALAHADLYYLEPAADRTGITIAEVRDLAARLAESPLEGARKVAVIDQADLMTTEAQNALLKTLEEPTADTTVILVAENTELLLPTVRSRCRRVNFVPLDEASLADIVAERGVPKERAKAVARVASGSAAKALRLVEGSESGARDELLGLLGGDELSPETLFDVLRGGRKGSLKERRAGAVELLGVLHSFVVDCMRVKAGSNVAQSVDFIAGVERFAAGRGPDELERLEKEAANAIIMLGMFADVELVTGRVAEAVCAPAVCR